MKLLVVEDDPTLQQALRRLLEQWGYAVEAASTAAAALAWLEQEHFDLVLLDLGLPDGDGLALCQTLRGWRLHQPLVLMLTARDGSGGGVVTVLAALLVGRRMLRVAVEPLQQQVSVGPASRCPSSSRCSIASGRVVTGADTRGWAWRSPGPSPDAMEVSCGSVRADQAGACCAWTCRSAHQPHDFFMGSAANLTHACITFVRSRCGGLWCQPHRHHPGRTG